MSSLLFLLASQPGATWFLFEMPNRMVENIAATVEVVSKKRKQTKIKMNFLVGNAEDEGSIQRC